MVSASLGALEPPNPGLWEWRFVAGGATVGVGAIDGSGNLYFAAEDRFLYALDPNGTMHWRVDLERRATGDVAVGPDGTIFAILENGTLLALNKDGRLIWRYREAGTRLRAPVVLDTGTVVVGAESGEVVGISHAGREVWRVSTGERIVADPVLGHDGRIHLATAGGSVISLGTDGGRIRSRYIGSAGSTLAPTAAGLVIGTADGHVIYLDREFEPLWRTDVGGEVERLLVGTEEHIYGLLSDGSVVHLSGGVATWRARPTPAVINGIAVLNDGILASLSNGMLAHIPPDGSLSWQVELPSAPLAPVLALHGVMNIPTEQWVIYSFSTEGVLDGAWPQPRGGERLSGVPVGVYNMRSSSAEYEHEFDYIYLREFLSSPFEVDQLAGIGEIEDRSGNYAGSYHYVLELCEWVAGGPFTGAEGETASNTFARSSRTRAITILGDIGDLHSVSALIRILRYEPYTDLQAAIMGSLARLGSVRGGDVIAIADRLVTDNAAAGPDDLLAIAASDLVAAVFEYEGGFADSVAIDILTTIVSSGYRRSTREYALAVLRSFGGQR